MPKVKWQGLEGNEADQDAAGFTSYDGPVPPKGVYQVKVKKLWLKVNKNDDHMVVGIGEIAETQKAKAKYNGYAIFFQQNVTPQSAPFLNALLDALGINRKVFYNQGVVTDSEDPPNILRCGKWKFTEGLEIRLNTKKGADQNGDPRLEVAGAGYLPARDEEPEDEPDEDEDEEDEYEDEDEDEDEDEYEDEDEDEDEDDEEEEDEEDDEEEDEEEDEEDEPEPPKRRVAKKAPAKKTAKKAAPARRGRGKAKVTEEDDYEEYEDGEDPF